MNKHMQAVSDDVVTLAKDARALVAATADAAGEKVSGARQGLAAGVANGRKVYGRARDQAIGTVRAAGESLRQHRYQVIGITVGVGALVAYLVAIRCFRKLDQLSAATKHDPVGPFQPPSPNTPRRDYRPSSKTDPGAVKPSGLPG
jgi:ElaB/YqjD/DUF883 family membrane-anchored ribosome-binding protein